MTLYETLNYENPYVRWEWYENREDLLQTIKIDFITKQLEETFVKGRMDSLKCELILYIFVEALGQNVFIYFLFILVFSHNAEALQEKKLEFFYLPRFDSLKELYVHNTYVKEHFHKRDDL